MYNGCKKFHINRKPEKLQIYEANLSTYTRHMWTVESILYIHMQLETLISVESCKFKRFLYDVWQVVGCYDNLIGVLSIEVLLLVEFYVGILGIYFLMWLVFSYTNGIVQLILYLIVFMHDTLYLLINLQLLRY